MSARNTALNVIIIGMLLAGVAFAAAWICNNENQAWLARWLPIPWKESRGEDPSACEQDRAELEELRSRTGAAYLETCEALESARRKLQDAVRGYYLDPAAAETATKSPLRSAAAEMIRALLPRARELGRQRAHLARHLEALEAIELHDDGTPRETARFRVELVLARECLEQGARQCPIAGAILDLCDLAQATVRGTDDAQLAAEAEEWLEGGCAR